MIIHRKISLALLFSIITIHVWAQTHPTPNSVVIDRVTRLGFPPLSQETIDNKYQINFDGEELHFIEKNGGKSITCAIKENTKQLIEDRNGKIRKLNFLEGGCPNTLAVYLVEKLNGEIQFRIINLWDGKKYVTHLKK
ncbi:hypothetical protein [Acidovorax sp.]|uniref:hypothetical protein n=1 Tax=Acidovorax sp. TaxID=1872122 RepID=UPI0025C624BC|nr:hypothetical protein [Acidovorax sp.]MBW8464570.1 hypothetical protein [Acidovorax sp.]